MTDCMSRTHKQLWTQIDAAGARPVAVNLLDAARSQTAATRAFNAAQVARALLGSEDAGRGQHIKAEVRWERRSASLRRAGRALEDVIDHWEETQRTEVESFLRDGGLQAFSSSARQLMLLQLLEADITADEAERALQRLDESTKSLGEIASLDDLRAYFARHVDELLEKRLGNPSPNGLCLLLLVLTSLYALFVLIAVVICIVTFGLVCEGVLEALIESACGVSRTAAS
jgi:hypothetical protein